MNAPRFLRPLFPPPRTPVTWRAALPLILFLALFLGGCLFVEMRGILRFSYRPAFWLALAMPWIWWMSVAGFSGLTKGRALVALKL